MKRRNGFVSNSSSSSFILKINELPQALLENIKTLPDMSDSWGRATGVIWDIESWLDEDWYGLTDIIAEYGNENLVLIRESDEEMNGSFCDYDIDWHEITELAVHQFEYH